MAQKNPPRPQRRRRKKKSALFTPLAFLLICAALVFGMSVFFRVSKIEVVGAVSYSTQEIIEASGVEEGDNLVIIDRSGSASRIKAKLPYVENVAVHRTLPNTVTIEVSESQALAFLAVEGELWVLDRNCKALNKTSSGQTEGLVQLLGVTANVPKIGEVVTGKDAEEAKLEYIAVILRELSARGMTGSVEALDLTNLANPTFDYLQRFQVKLGKNEDVDYKLDRLLSVVEQLSPNDIGTLDLSIDDRVHYTQG